MTKDEVIKGSLWQVTVYAAFQRAKVYSDTAGEDQRRGVKQTLEKEIHIKLPQYDRAVTEEMHINNILEIAKAINKKWSEALDQGEIPIGVVQKAFNLYLKLMWCLEEISEPPHCPIDKIIVDKLPPNDRTSWTRMRNIETYKDLVINLKKLAKQSNKSLAVWELENYEKTNP